MNATELCGIMRSVRIVNAKLHRQLNCSPRTLDIKSSIFPYKSPQIKNFTLTVTNTMAVYLLHR